MLYIYVENCYINSHGKERICYMEILKPLFGLDIFLNAKITQSQLVRYNSTTFKYHIKTDAQHTFFHRITIAYIIEIYAANNNNKRGRTFNMIRKYLRVGNNLREFSQNPIKASLMLDILIRIPFSSTQDSTEKISNDIP